MAQLPREWAIKQYKVGDTGWAAVFEIKGSRVLLSQKSPQYVRKMLEYLLAKPFKEYEITIKKVARIKIGGYYKVAVVVNGNMPKNSTGRNQDLNKVLNPYLININNYIEEKVYFVKYAIITTEYVVNALAPAPSEAVRKVMHYPDINHVEIWVDNRYTGLFMGQKKMNVLTSSKLTGVTIQIKPVSQTLPTVSAYGVYNRKRR